MKKENESAKSEMELLLEEIAALKAEREELVKKVGEKGEGRKEQVVNLIRTNGRISIKDIGEAIGISERNVSSQLSYLRKDGLKFGKDSKGRIYEEKEE